MIRSNRNKIFIVFERRREGYEIGDVIPAVELYRDETGVKVELHSRSENGLKCAWSDEHGFREATEMEVLALAADGQINP